LDTDGFLRSALAEDLGDAGDVTSAATIPEDARVSGHIVARAGGCIAGLGVALRTFTLLDGEVRAEPMLADGTVVGAGSRLAAVSGPARSILSAERVALNLLGHLSGIATATRALVDRIEGTRARIVDTRKTMPTLRALEKAAVRAGGGGNHRMGLYDAVLIKDNHVQAVGSVAAAVARAREALGRAPATVAGPTAADAASREAGVGASGAVAGAPGGVAGPGGSARMTIEVEIDRLEDLEEAIAAGADIVLLDNMDPETMRAAVERAAGRCLLEASGGITLETVREVAETGVDLISVGWITHSAPALDVALDLEV
jgi:nicotinate-nucleotide pyrophosphorylase (carboxylating)